MLSGQNLVLYNQNRNRFWTPISNSRHANVPNVSPIQNIDTIKISSASGTRLSKNICFPIELKTDAILANRMSDFQLVNPESLPSDCNSIPVRRNNSNVR